MSTQQGQWLAAKHPLQRLPSPSRGVSALVHTLGIISAAYSFHFLIYQENTINEAWGWHMQFLTVCGLLLASVTYVLALAADTTLSRHLFYAKNIVSLASAPLAFCISVLYWGIRAVDPSLLMHPDLPPLGLLEDLSLHAAPALLLGIDVLALSPPWALKPLPALGLSSAVAVAYWFWVEQCFLHNGYYPYPLFAVLDTRDRVLLFAAAAVVMAASMMALTYAYALVNGKEEESLRADERPGHVKKTS
ncbi:uncharacterized protein K452DRAFT_287706 [Aplosporella prunicola CBS 121167]|uniref:FAR-17a/AIG1-like protein n=1 Tax=Aplosporella prunicola CBS 121167 TaxID=1176127 RepID=A0A6A6BCF9_9PEZI|nr:uncharacterized protein K452DRAFT_287706 [Aplosporella prunicola CBS 121167]KAF2141746.1 hypothetical protein K452DRAFT_287706 [Aplosporella prunicola CBS 121167]